MKLNAHLAFVFLMVNSFGCSAPETMGGPDVDAGPDADAGPGADAGPDATAPIGPTQLAAGQFFTCALISGRVACWGSNASGQLGDGTGAPQKGAVFVTGIDDAVEIAAGQTHMCARTASGAVRCWGRNEEGQLGD